MLSLVCTHSIFQYCYRRNVGADKGLLIGSSADYDWTYPAPVPVKKAASEPPQGIYPKRKCSRRSTNKLMVRHDYAALATSTLLPFRKFIPWWIVPFLSMAARHDGLQTTEFYCALQPWYAFPKICSPHGIFRRKQCHFSTFSHLLPLCFKRTEVLCLRTILVFAMLLVPQEQLLRPLSATKT